MTRQRNYTLGAALLAAAVAVCAHAGYGVLAGWHLAGHAQSVLWPVLGLLRLAGFPGEVAAMMTVGAARSGVVRAPAFVAVATATTFLFYMGLWFVLTGGARRLLTRTGWRKKRVMGDDLEAEGRQAGAAAQSRREFLGRAAGAVAFAGAGGATIYSVVLEPRLPRIERHRVALRGLPKELAGLRVAQLSDIHHGPWMSLAHVRKVVNMVNGLVPDLVLLTGDYVLRHRGYIAPCAEVLGGLKARLGVLAVMGNHDWWESALETRRALGAAGIELIDNDRRVIAPDGTVERAGGVMEGLAIAGIGDYWEGDPDFAAALDGLPEGMPRILMSHNPDAAEDQLLARRRWRVDLMVSGHTHGGQVRLPLLGTPVVPSDFGQKYAAGFVNGPVCRVYINRGIGMAVLPVRLGVPPEITVFELEQG